MVRTLSMSFTAAFTILLLGGQAVAAAQETRADLLRDQREEKQQELAPPESGWIERTTKAVERSGVPLITRDGVYLKFGTLTTGSGFAFGGGWRSRRFLGREAGLDAWAGMTASAYWETQARFQAPIAPGRRVLLHAFGRYQDYPREDFFGLGPDSARVAFSDFRLKGPTVGTRADVRVAGPIVVGGGVDFMAPRVTDGKDKRLPSISETFDATSAPGLDSDTDFLRSYVTFEVDNRQPRNARKGFWYRADLSHYSDRKQERYSFDRFDIDLRQFVSVLSERRVFTGRAYVSTATAADGQTIPFYLMPTLGGNETLRGFRAYRFRGPHALLLQGEYRFEVWSGLDAALFYDAGKVAMRRKDLDLDGLERNYGFGFRFNTDAGTILRIDTALGSREGVHFWVVFGGTF
jgi:outer membrane protein assembly factor BamA